jgi:maltose operon protein
MNFKTILLSGCLAALTGCQSTDVIAPQTNGTQQQISQFNALQTVAVELPSKSKVTMTKDTQYLRYGDVDSPVAAFKVPANQGTLEFTVTSLIEDEVFVPAVKVFTENGDLLAYIPAHKFESLEPRLAWGYRLESEFKVVPLPGETSVVVVVYTDKDNLGKTTPIKHPAKLDAERRGNYFPIDDVQVPNSLEGIIELAVESTGQVVEQKPEISVQPETKNYYLSEIEKAVAEDNIPKALSLLDEAKALNVEGAQEVFVKAINAK